MHQNSWNEYSGTPILTQNYAYQCLKNGHQVCIVTPNSSDQVKYFKNNGINYIQINPKNNWSEETFLNKQINYDNEIKLPFKPSIIHVIDWVNFDIHFLFHLKKFNVPIIRHINSFEDFCYFTHPIYKNKNKSLCLAPLTTGGCTECIIKKKNDNLKVLKKIDFFLFKKNELIKNFHHSLPQRKKIIIYKFKYLYNHLIFGSKSFSKYFLKHLNYKLDYSIIPHGINKYDNTKLDINKNFEQKKINIVYAGGRSERKGWNIIESVFKMILKNYNKEINLRIYGDKSKLSKSKISNSSCVKFYDYVEPSKLDNEIKWADIAILPTHFEPYGILIREFLKNRVIPITTNTFGHSDIIINNKNGFIIKPPIEKNLEKKLIHIIKNKHELLKVYNNIKETRLLEISDEFTMILSLYNKLQNNES